MIHIQFHDAVAEIRMDRPPANALNHELIERLLAALETARMEGVRAIILTGRPGMFSGGLDVPGLLGLDRRRIEGFWQLFFQLARQLASSPVPVIAALSGHAPAGGAVLALNCDHRIGIGGNFRIGLNEVRVGLPVPPSILATLVDVVGTNVGRRLAMRGELLTMDEALAVGLVDELTTAEELPSVARARAAELLALPPVAMNTTRLAAKSRLLEALAGQNDAALATDWWFSAETQAGMQALVGKLRKD